MNNTRIFNADFKRAEGDENSRRFTLSFSSEEPYERWFGSEILSHDEGAIDLKRLTDIGVVLFNHDRDEVIGKVTRCWIENRRGMAEIEFDDDEMSEKILKKVQSGTLKGVSVGYNVGVWEEVAVGKKSANGRFKGPCSVATKWTPLEISIVSVPADATVGVGRAEGDDYPVCLKLAERQIRINENKHGGKNV